MRAAKLNVVWYLLAFFHTLGAPRFTMVKSGRGAQQETTASGRAIEDGWVGCTGTVHTLHPFRVVVQGPATHCCTGTMNGSESICRETPAEKRTILDLSHRHHFCTGYEDRSQ